MNQQLYRGLGRAKTVRTRILFPSVQLVYWTPQILTHGYPQWHSWALPSILSAVANCRCATRAMRVSVPESSYGAPLNLSAYSLNRLESEDADEMAELNVTLEILDAIQEETGVNIAPFLLLSRPPSPIILPRNDEAVQTADVDANPATGGDMPEPRRHLDERLGRLEHAIMTVKDSQLQDAQRKKRARRAWKRRENRRQNCVALAEDTPGNGLISGPRITRRFWRRGCQARFQLLIGSPQIRTRMGRKRGTKKRSQ
jgi:hypothetical protein